MVFVLGVFFSANAQQRSTTKSDLKLSLLAPELIYEMEIGNASSLKLGVGLGALQFNNESEVTWHLSVQAMPRFFTTREKRMRMGKNIDHFSGGYLSIPIDYRVGLGFDFGLAYGVQGSFANNKMFYDLFIGLGYGSFKKNNKAVNTLVLPNGVSLGFVF